MLRERSAAELASWFAGSLRSRNAPAKAFFEREAPQLACVARAMAERFQAGGRLFAFGGGPYATDAAHVSVEFVHPVIVGKRALPAVDLSRSLAALDILLRPGDMLVAFGPPEGDAAVLQALHAAHERGVYTIALPGTGGDYACDSPSADAHVHQEIFEIVSHTLYESVHVFLERRSLGGDVGASGFLYPYLGAAQNADGIVDDVAASILAKSNDAETLRETIAAGEAEALAAATMAAYERLAAGGKLLLFGNGGSATDADDWMLDCVDPPPGMRAVPAISLSGESAILTAVANDVGTDLMFVRQIIARAEPQDVAIALSTSGGSANVVAALAEARKRGLLTLALLGYDGGEIARHRLADHVLVVRSDYIPRIQEAQAAIYHTMRAGWEAIRRHAA